GAQAIRIAERGGKVDHIELADGGRLKSDLVLVSIGVVPNGELAAATGLSVANGIVVDEQLATADPAISAIGDCCDRPADHAHARRLLSAGRQVTPEQAADDGFDLRAAAAARAA